LPFFGVDTWLVYEVVTLNCWVALDFGANAAIVELDAAFNVHTVEPLDPILKVEGLSARVAADGVHILCVTDADDPERVAGVYGG
jgi:hypothetical protein